MKKYFYLCLFMLCILNIGCNDNEEENSSPTFKVISASTSLPAIGGTGEIELSVVGDYVVNSTEEWCAPVLSGNKVLLTISANEDITGRNALIEICMGTESTVVPVTQLGAIFSTNFPAFYNFSTTGERKAYYLKSNLPYEIKYDSKWLSHKVEGDSVIFTSIPYEEGTLTEKIIPVTIRCGKTQQTYSFCQTIYKDFQGKYDISYIDKTNKTVSHTAQLLKYQPDKYVMIDGPMSGAQFVVDYDNGKLIIVAGQYLGTSTPLFVYNCVLADNDNITWDKSSQYMAIPEIRDGKVRLSFKDNGTFPGNKVIGLYFAGFSTKEPSSGSYAGGLDRAIDIVMIKQ